MGFQRTTVFVSYSQKNKRWLQRLRVHLTPYDRKGVLALWDDTRLDPGDKWRTEISDAMERAAASILLISADFLASDFVATEELPRLLHRAEEQGARILPIYVEPCEIASHPELASFQSLNPPSKPLAEMTRVDAERVLVRAVETVAKILSSPVPLAPQAVTKRSATPTNPNEDAMFEELHSATVALSIVLSLKEDGASLTLGDLAKTLQIHSRKRAFEVAERLAAEGWLAKSKSAGLMRYQLTAKGARQVERLAAASDGPVRRFRAGR